VGELQRVQLLIEGFGRANFFRPAGSEDWHEPTLGRAELIPQ
jgi:hypothetical protein